MRIDAKIILRWLRLGLVPLFIVGVVYVVYGVVAQFNQVVSAVSRMSILGGAFALVAAIGAVAARAIYRLALYDIAGYGKYELPRALALQSFAWGQLLRYLPGKVSGPAAEAVMLESHVPWRALLRITIFETVAMMSLSFFWLTASFLYMFYFRWSALACLTAGILATWYLHYRKPWLHQPSCQEHPVSYFAILTALGMLVAEWILFYLIWASVSGAAWFVSATAYAAASWGAAVVLVAPAGFGVRELFFTELTPYLSALAKVDLLGQAIVMRVLLTMADVLLPAGLLAFNRGLINDRS